MPPLPSKNRVLVWPNRNAIGLGAVLAAMGYAGASQNNGAAYLLCFVLAALTAVSAMHTWINVRGIAISADPIAPVFAGETLQVSVTLTSRLPRDHFSIDAGPRRLASKVRFDLIRASEMVRGHVPNPAPQRGHFTEIEITLQSVFPLGFFTARTVIAVRQPYFVYPSPLGASALPVDDVTTAQPKGGLRIEGDDFGGVRPWLPGESQRHIDWKAASRGQALLTKQWTGESDEIVRLDWESLAPRDTETRLSQLARWIITARESGVQYGLRLPGQVFEPARGEEHFHSCLRALAGFTDPGRK